jgi:hypothetical protein
MEERPVTEVMDALAELHISRGLPPLNELPTPYEYGKIGKWELVINGSREDATWSREEGAVTIPPFTLYVEYNGWPAGMINPYEGEILAADGEANEQGLIEAIRGGTTS